MSRASVLSLQPLRAPRQLALLWLLLAAMFARGLVAPGFMPAFGAGGVGIVLCTPQGPKTLWQQADPAAARHADGGGHCAFGVSLDLAGVAPQAPLLALAGPVFVDALPLPAWASTRVPGGHSARGPPIHS